MHLAEVIVLRAVPAAGVIFELTRRCPLACAHCSTRSSLGLAEYGADPFVKLVRSFTPTDRPEVIALTGGEPLLRPDLVSRIAQAARAVGARTHVLTGMFFARSPSIPPAIRRALMTLDHISASLDVFHEAEVPRAAVFRVFDELLAEGKAVSLQIVGTGDDDPYIATLVEDVRSHFDDRVPMLVSAVRPEGRAKEWLEARDETTLGDLVEPMPCAMAAWPVVCADGRVTACCNQSVVDGADIPHLRLGDAGIDPWHVLRARCRDRPSLKAIRTLGPRYVAQETGLEPCAGYCNACHRLEPLDDAASGRRAREGLRPELLHALDAFVTEAQKGASAVRFAERFGLGAYAPLVTLGREKAAL